MEYKTVSDILSAEVHLLYKKHAVKLRPLWKKYVDVYKNIFYRILNSDIKNPEWVYNPESKNYEILQSIALVLLTNNKKDVECNAQSNVDYANNKIRNLGKDFVITVDNLDEFLLTDISKDVYFSPLYIRALQMYKNHELMQYIDLLVDINKELLDEIQGLEKRDRVVGIVLADINTKNNMAVFIVDTSSSYDSSQNVSEFIKCLAEDTSDYWKHILVQF